jgi:hypothetical protein
VTDPAPTPTTPTRDRIDAALRRLGATLERLFAHMQRRRVTLRDRNGSVWARMPMTLAVILLVLAVVYWLPIVVLLMIVGFALGAQLSVDVATPAPARAPHDEHTPSA